MSAKKELRKIEFENELKSQDAKIISEIDVNVVLVTAQTAEDYLDDYNHCPLCGNELTYTHVTHFVRAQVAEDAHCDTCHVRTKSNVHGLH